MIDEANNFNSFLKKYLKKRNLENKFEFYYTSFNRTVSNHFSKTFVENAIRTRNQKNVFLIIDLISEGFSLYENKYYKYINKFCENNQIPKEKIIFVTSNLNEEKCLEIYKNKNISKDSINVFGYMFFRYFYIEKYSFRYMKSKSINNYQGKYFLSLSRVNRPFRTLMQYQIYANDLEQYSIQSHNKIDKEHYIDIVKSFNVNKKSLKNWSKKLPLIADFKNFKVNHAFKPNTHLYQQTLFELANETKVENFNNTSLFYSEKTFKPMHSFQPFFIYGQQHCNQKLEEYGFKLYRNHFNYDFDNEPNDEKRCLMIIDELKRVCSMLDKMTREEQLAWKYQDEDILLHNYDYRFDRKTEEVLFNKLIDKLCTIVDKTE